METYNDFFKGKKVLVTGGTGLIGQPLCSKLVKLGAEVTVASLDDPSRTPQGTTFTQVDLRSFENCQHVAKDHQVVMHLAGVKGSPRMTAERPASFFVPTLQFSLNMMEAARRAEVENYLFTSSVGVYAPAEVFQEESVWSTFPSPNDRFAGWAKRMCELQAEAYKIEYKWDKISIVRPANVYGPFDNFDPANAMVIPSLIHRATNGERPLTVWGDGSPVRDFIHAADVAHGMLLAVSKGINEPINLGSGTGITIKQVAESVAQNVGEIMEGKPLDVVWDTTKPSGDAKRLMDMTKAASYGFECQVGLNEGIRQTIEWYLENKDAANTRYNSFTDPAHTPHAA